MDEIELAESILIEGHNPNLSKSMNFKAAPEQDRQIMDENSYTDNITAATNKRGSQPHSKSQLNHFSALQSAENTAYSGFGNNQFSKTPSSQTN
jgi:hypothetical protein